MFEKEWVDPTPFLQHLMRIILFTDMYKTFMVQFLHGNCSNTHTEYQTKGTDSENHVFKHVFVAFFWWTTLNGNQIEWPLVIESHLDNSLHPLPPMITKVCLTVSKAVPRHHTASTKRHLVQKEHRVLPVFSTLGYQTPAAVGGIWTYFWTCFSTGTGSGLIVDFSHQAS